MADRLKQTMDGINALLPLVEREAERRALRSRRRECFRQWEAALRVQLHGRNEEFAAAAKAFQVASREISAAKRDLRRIGQAVEAAAAAAKLADRALELAMKVM